MAGHSKGYMHAYYVANRERIRAQHKAHYYAKHAYWKAKARGYRHTANLKRYGLNPTQYNEMFDGQDGRCAICRQLERIHKKGKRVRLAVDHDTKNGTVRGLLCGACNRAIGALKHDPEILRRAIRYLLKGSR